jgi:hypothetical protein
MTTLKSVNWALAWRRSIWTVVWAAMMALLVVMCIDLAANQPVIFGIVMLAAFVGSIGLAYTRVSWQNGARATAGAALIVSLLAICTHAFMEASYWSSVIEQINQEVTAERAVSDARAAVAEKRKERYVSSSNGRSAGQIEAELKAAETNVLFARSGSCANATAKESRDFCQGYFLLQAKHAAAVEAGHLESVIWSAGTTVETTTKRNLASIAVMASSIFGGQPEQYTALIVITLVLFTQALLAFALVIGWAPEKAREAAGATFQRPISLASSFADPAYNSVSVARTPLKALEKIAGVKVGEENFVDPSGKPDATTLSAMESAPDPDGPGTPAPAPEEPKIEEVAEDRANVLPFKTSHDTQAEWKIEKHKRDRANENSVTRWLRDRTSPLGDNQRGKPAHELLPDYLKYCRQRGETALSKRKFSTVLRGELDLPKLRGADGKRKSAALRFPIELLAEVASAKRRVA